MEDGEGADDGRCGDEGHGCGDLQWIGHGGRGRVKVFGVINNNGGYVNRKHREQGHAGHVFIPAPDRAAPAPLPCATFKPRRGQTYHYIRTASSESFNATMPNPP